MLWIFLKSLLLFTGQAQHIMISGGPKLTVPVTEFTLKGAKKEAIAKVFGLRIYEAIADDFQQRSYQNIY